jgi:peptidoglycan/LPS O-acetylase OafA/YrhL
VLIDHIGYSLRLSAAGHSTGGHGVAIFFVLSGFLITTRLADEKQRNGSISLFKFYIRRFFRLMPCAWIYLLFIFVISISDRHRDIITRGILGSIFFIRNYVFRGATNHSLTTHFWSLSIEEQFYIIWPSVLIFADLKLARWMAVTGAFAVGLYRRLRAKPEQIIVDVHAATPSSWKMRCMALRIVS